MKIPGPWLLLHARRAVRGSGAFAAVCTLAATSVAALSCGSGKGGEPAGAVDGGADARPSRDGASARPGVTITVMASGKPVRQARVLFHDETGRILEDTATNDSGRATRSPAPAMVTVQDGSGSQLLTFVGVVDGDTLTVTGDEALPSDPVYIGSYLVAVPGAFPAADSSFKSWIGYCDPGFGGDPTLPVEVFAADDCARTGEAVLLAASTRPVSPWRSQERAGSFPLVRRRRISASRPVPGRRRARARSRNVWERSRATSSSMAMSARESAVSTSS